MSSSKTAAARAAKPIAKPAAAARAAKPTARRPALTLAAGTATPKAAANPPAEALRLSGLIEAALRDGRLDILPPESFQAIMASLAKLYSANVEQGAPYLPVGPRSGVTPTDVMVMASKLLRATNLQVFELGMWQSWTGR